MKEELKECKKKVVEAEIVVAMEAEREKAKGKGKKEGTKERSKDISDKAIYCINPE